MTLEQQVVSLELAKKLKELGVKQESVFSWYEDSERDDEPALNRASRHDCPTCGFPKQRWHKEYSAFTVAELGEMLPKGYWDERSVFGGFEVGYSTGEPIGTDAIDRYFTLEPSEADARAKMLIYLIDNQLITLP